MKTDEIRIIVADNRASNRRGLKALLAFEPRIIIIGEAADGHEAVQLVEEKQPDLVLMDIQMPVMDGPSFAEWLHALPDRSVANTPIVILTGAQEDDDAASRARALEALRKPVSFQRLIEVVHRHCRDSE